MCPVKMAEPIEMSYIGRGLVEANKPRIMWGPGSPGGKGNAYTCSWSMSSTLLAIGGSIDAASGYQHCSNLFPTSLLLSSICGFFFVRCHLPAVQL